MQQHRYSGFSLLEITFVILLVSITVVSTSVYIKNANQKSAAQKVASQINYWLNTATYYYSTQGEWPSDLTSLAALAGVSLPADQPYSLQPSSTGQGASISVKLPSPAFALLVKSELARAIIDTDQVTLYAYTPPTATAIASEGEVKGVGYLNFYNCKSDAGPSTTGRYNCSTQSFTMGTNGLNRQPCFDPLNTHSYDLQKAQAFQSTSTTLSNNSTSGVCAIPVPECAPGTVPQIYYAISQFRAPYAPEMSSTTGYTAPAHKYQNYPYQVNAVCQVLGDNGTNLGPCGPNTVDDPNIKYFSLGMALRNFQIFNGVTEGIMSYAPFSNPADDNWYGNSQEEHDYNWSALISYVVACIRPAQIRDNVSGGNVYQMSPSSKTTCTSQDMMGINGYTGKQPGPGCRS